MVETFVLCNEPTGEDVSEEIVELRDGLLMTVPGAGGGPLYGGCHIV